VAAATDGYVTSPLTVDSGLMMITMLLDDPAPAADIGAGS
jgi:hypothetical protein